MVEGPGQLSLLYERILPDLSKNIQCGNSLIGPDYYEGQQMALFDEEEQYRVNAFDWQQAFPQIFREGGFGAVIGNPPYGASLDKELKIYLNKRYPFAADYETSQYFLIKSNSLLSKGYLGYIVPNTLFLNINANKFREFLVNNFQINSLSNLSLIDVFSGATVRTAIIILSKLVYSSKPKFMTFTNINEIVLKQEISQKMLVDNDSIWLSAFENNSGISQKINEISIPLGDILEISQGLIPYDKYRGHDEYTIKNRIWNSDHKNDDTYKMELRGGDVQRYSVSWNGKQWISYGPWLAAPRKQKYFTEPRLLFREITDPKTGLLHVAYTELEFYNNPAIINCIKIENKYSLFYLLGICASKLLAFYHFSTSPKANKGIFPKILVNDVRKLPIRIIDFNNPTDVTHNERMVNLVQSMLDMHKQFHQPLLPQEKERLQRQIDWTDREIDKLVYELYDLTDEEIKIVEGEG